MPVLINTIILSIDSITLEGSNSHDSEGRISTWLWTTISGYPPFLQFANQPSGQRTIFMNRIISMRDYSLFADQKNDADFIT